jgi:hypothetical protein
MQRRPRLPQAARLTSRRRHPRSRRCSSAPIGRARRANAHAALAFLSGRVDFLEEIGNAQLVVAKSHSAELDVTAAAEWLDHAERTFTELGSTSHLAAVCIARGDLARKNGDCNDAAELYRHAAESLQDFHF